MITNVSDPATATRQRDQFPYLAKRPQIATLSYGRAEEHVIRGVLAAVVAADVAFAAEPTSIPRTPMHVGGDLADRRARDARPSASSDRGPETGAGPSAIQCDPPPS